jgi:hypothetical protein
MSKMSEHIFGRKLNVFWTTVRQRARQMSPKIIWGPETYTSSENTTKCGSAAKDRDHRSGTWHDQVPGTIWYLARPGRSGTWHDQIWYPARSDNYLIADIQIEN